MPQECDERRRSRTKKESPSPAHPQRGYVLKGKLSSAERTYFLLEHNSQSSAILSKDLRFDQIDEIDNNNGTPNTKVPSQSNPGRGKSLSDSNCLHSDGQLLVYILWRLAGNDICSIAPTIIIAHHHQPVRVSKSFDK
jgi:hypothetical protein